jgi:heptosyltransferase II
MCIKHFVKKIYIALRGALLWVFFRPISSGRAPIGPVLSILVVRIDRIGDVIVSLPAIKALKGIFPDARISLLLREEVIPLLRGVTYIDELLPYRGLIDSYTILRNKKFSIAIDLLMDYPVKPAAITLFSRAKFRAGFDMEGKGVLFNLALKPNPEARDVTSYMIDLVRAIAQAYGIDNSSIKVSSPEIVLSDADRSFARTFLADNGLVEDGLLVGIHPGGRFLSQRWMPERFSELAMKIAEEYNAGIIIVGALSEAGLIGKIAASLGPRAAVAAGLPLNKLAALIERMDLVVCNNSGPWHIACALDVPTVSTMGPTNYSLWRPISGEHIVVRKDIPCAPCDLAVCNTHDCMKGISVDDMMKAVRVQMEKIGAG